MSAFHGLLIDECPGLCDRLQVELSAWLPVTRSSAARTFAAMRAWAVSGVLLHFGALKREARGTAVGLGAGRCVRGAGALRRSARACRREHAPFGVGWQRWRFA